MRLAMYLASEEGWLVEHMNLFGVKSKDGKITYFAGAFPSMCGKTATAMMSGFGDGEGNGGIVGDDIVHIKVVEGEDGVKRLAAVNVENGMFGIIKDVNAKDDPEIFNAIVDGEEVIVSNVLVASNGDYRWIGDERGEYPAGRNFQGEWSPEQAGKIPPSHKNARFTLPLKNLANLDANLDNPGGVPLGALVYGGRDSNTWVPVCQALNWHHGINTMAASLESETTAAALGKEGVRVSNPMANLDFLSVTMGRYISDNNNIVDGVDEPPAIFGVNYFLIGEDGQFLNGKNDKVVWYQWMALRINGEVDAIETPVGHIPKYEDLMPLFQEHLGQEYTKTQYDEQFKIRVPELIAKVDRGLAYFDDKGDDVPEILKKDLLSQKERLEKTLNS
jgi:phosphoenolpyruvate carboxykinase (GTP)